MEQMPTLQCAETHPAYCPKPRDPRAEETIRIARSVNELKVMDPDKGSRVYDGLVDQLVSNALSLAKQPEHANEPTYWTAPQRCVWRSSQLPYERRSGIIADRSIVSHVKGFACVSSGRWIVSCPLPRCNGAQYASFLDRRYFCVERMCNNQSVDGRWIEVIWPNDVSQIEDWLTNRPDEHRHWNPGETMEDIMKQDHIMLGVV